MIETRKLGPIDVRSVDKNSSTCKDVNKRSSTVPGHYSSSPQGKDVTNAPLIKGNHVDALPYWTSIIDCDNGSAPFTYVWTQNTHVPCGFSRRATYTGVLPQLVQLNKADLPRKTFSPKDRSFVDNIASTKARANLRKAMVNVPILVKERLQSLDSAKRIAGDLARAATAIQKRDLSAYRKLKSAKSKKQFAKAAAGRHLEFIFGILPLVEEAEGLYNMAVDPVLDFVTGRGRMTMVKESPYKRNRVLFPWTKQPIGYASVRARNIYSVRVALRADITGHFGRTAQRLGANPIYTWYDFTPLSFISGWVSNFNHCVQALDPLLGAEFRTGAITRRERASAVQTVALSATSSATQGHEATGHGRQHYSTDLIQRSVLTSEPDINFSFYNNFSTYSVFAGISLYVQRRIKPLERAMRNSPFKWQRRKPKYLPPINYK